MTCGSGRGARRLTAAGLVSVVLLSAGCGGSDQRAVTAVALSDDRGEALTVADSAATIARAVEVTRAASGRFESRLFATMTEINIDEDEPEDLRGTFAWTVVGGYDEDASTSTVLFGDEELDGRALEVTTPDALVVAGRTYLPAAPLREREQFASDDDNDDDDVEGHPEFRAPDPYEGSNFRALDGKEWVEMTGLDLTFPEECCVNLSVVRVPGVPPQDPFAILDGMTEVREIGTEELDGTSARHFTAVVHDDQRLELLFGDEGGRTFGGRTLDGEARRDAIDRYVAAHSTITADLYLDAMTGQLLQVRVDAASHIEPQYADCGFIVAVFRDVSMTTTFTGSGSAVVIEPPEPASVLSLHDLTTAFPDRDWIARGPGQGNGAFYGCPG